MEGEVTFGTNADGSQNQDYCGYCFVNGAFQDSYETIEEMVTECAPMWVEESGVMYPTEAVAAAYLRALLPTLKRWKTA